MSASISWGVTKAPLGITVSDLWFIYPKMESLLDFLLAVEPALHDRRCETVREGRDVAGLDVQDLID